jgi:tRNA (guanine-N7-)-methyltransferase
MTRQPSTSETQQIDAMVRVDPHSLPPFDEIFGNGNPVEIEIGCGKAKFLIARASEHPQVNFLGIDIVWRWMRYAIERTEKRSLRNAKFIKADVHEVVRHGIRSQSVSIFHIYFPDPWPKRRHHKRRLITGAFLRELYAGLAPNGLIELATDHVDYFVQMRGAIINSGISWSGVTTKLNERLFEAAAGTNYEIKYASAGRTLHYLELKK